MAAPERARLSMKEHSHFIQYGPQSIGLSYASANKAWDMCHTEALEAAAGLVALLAKVETIWREEEGLDFVTERIGELLPEIAEQKTIWDKFLEGN